MTIEEGILIGKVDNLEFTEEGLAAQPHTNETKSSEGWKTMELKRKAIKELVIVLPSILIMQTRKQAPASSILDASIWNTLALPLTPREEIPNLASNPCKTTKRESVPQLLLGKLLSTQIHIAPHFNP
jgi:hypothetical protein